MSLDPNRLLEDYDLREAVARRIERRNVELLDLGVDPLMPPIDDGPLDFLVAILFGSLYNEIQLENGTNGQPANEGRADVTNDKGGYWVWVVLAFAIGLLIGVLVSTGGVDPASL